MERNNNASEKPKEGCCTRFGRSMRNLGLFIFNPSTKEFLGRGGMSWLQILAFYIAFYAVLAGFWAACLVGFIRTLDPLQPTMQKLYSMMKDNPGVNFEPFPDDTVTLIYFTPNKTDTYSAYLKNLNTAYSQSMNLSMGTNLMNNCSDSNTANVNQGCRFDMSSLGDCTPSNNFGYDSGYPCVLLRINKVYRWDPNGATFNDTLNSTCSLVKNQGLSYCTKMEEFDNLPNTIKTTNLTGGNILVSCQGENDGDADNILNVTYYPSNGFPAYHYPYYNQEGFMSPIVMAQFNVIRGRVSLIWCRIWTVNVVHDLVDLQGSIHIELFVDK